VIRGSRIEDRRSRSTDDRSQGAIHPHLQSSILDLQSSLSWRRRLRWLILAFVPSSMMLGVTMYLTTDIAPIPLLWVIPLAIYLLSFILVFAQHAIVPHRLMVRILPVVALVLMFLLFAEDMKPPIWLLIPLHLLMLFTTAMVCHGELARDRPPPAHLTEFYLWLALGGVLGGIFNAIIAPLVFRRVLEYPLAIILACLLRPGVGGRRSTEYGVRSTEQQASGAILNKLCRVCSLLTTPYSVLRTSSGTHHSPLTTHSSQRWAPK